MTPSTASRLLLSLALFGCNAEVAGAPRPLPEADVASPELEALPWAERLEVERALGAGDARLLPRMDEGGASLETPGSVVARFGADGARLAHAGSEVSLGVSAIGRGGSPVALALGAHEVRGPEVRATLAPGIVEWWRSLPSGLEHGVTISERPAGEGELRVEVAVGGELAPHLLSPDEVELRAESGATVLSYAHLVVLDATGATIPAAMSVEGGRIVLTVADEGARYPLVVDPLVFSQEATLAPSPVGPGNQRVGLGVSFTADGTRAIVSGLDGARIFVRSGSTWTLERNLGAGTGGGVAISADGTRAIVGFAAGPTVAVLFFARSGSSWTEEARILTPGNPFFGQDVAISGDGSRAAVGAESDTTASVRVYVRSGASWAMEAAFEPQTGAATGATALAMSRDGALLLVGEQNYNAPAASMAGRVQVYRRSGSAWSVETTLGDVSPVSGSHFGSAVAISADQSRVVVGAEGAGTAVVYRVSSWALEGILVHPSGGGGGADFGWAVTISGDGRRVVVGAPRDDERFTDGGSVRVFSRLGTAWSYETDLVAPDRAAGDNHGMSVGISDDGTRVVAGATLDDLPGGTSCGSARVYVVRVATGSPCLNDLDCESGFCTDGVCCNARCGGDCEACSNALSGRPNGTCTAASTSTECRASTGACDPAENCQAGGGSCPSDTRLAAGAVCRASGGVCDPAEVCDGAAGACPADVREPATFECRAATTPCDWPELCDGTSALCPPPGSSGVRPSGHTCRASAGLCDNAEVCDGATVNCPGDVLVAAGVACGAMPGSCASTGMCTGSSPACAGSGLLPMGTVCLYASPANPCDVDDICDGTSTTCTPRFAAMGVVCNDLLSGTCDAPDVCTGTSADCVPTFLAGVECREARGACDAAEVCGGGSPVCPPDALVEAGLSCRASSDTRCDPEETCDGVAASCPADVTACVSDAGPPDAGPRDAGERDAAVAPDGGAPVAIAGCACRAHGGTSGTPVGILALAVVLTMTRRRRRRRR